MLQQAPLATRGGSRFRGAARARLCAPQLAPAQRSRCVSARFSHRSEQLVDLAKEFGAAWGAALRANDSDTLNKAISALDQLCDPDISVQSKHPLGSAQIKGMDPLRQRLEALHKQPTAKATGGGNNQQAAGEPGSTPDVPKEQQARVVLAAADEQSDTAFILMQLPASKVEGKGQASPSHVLIKMEMLLSDGFRRVSSLVERAQLPCSLGAVTDNDASVQHMRHQQEAAPAFPVQLVKPWASNEGQQQEKDKQHHGAKRVGPGSELYERVQSALNAWVSARSSDSDTSALLKEAGCGNEFELLDAFGMVPLTQKQQNGAPHTQAQSGKSAQAEPEGDAKGKREGGDMTGEDEKRAMLLEQGKARVEAAKRMDAGETPGSQVTGREVQQLLENMKTVYEAEFKVVDSAVCMDEAAAFTHWRSCMKNKVTGEQRDVEGMEVNVLDPETGALKASYVFRDLMDFEQSVLGSC